MENEMNSIKIENIKYRIQKVRKKIFFTKGINVYCFGKTDPNLYLDGFESIYKRKFRIVGEGTFFDDSILLYEKDSENILHRNVTVEFNAYDTEGLTLSEVEKNFKNTLNKGSLFYFDKKIVIGISTSTDLIENIINNFNSKTKLEIDIDVDLFELEDILSVDQNNDHLIYKSFILPKKNHDVDFLAYTMKTAYSSNSN